MVFSDCLKHGLDLVLTSLTPQHPGIRNICPILQHEHIMTPPAPAPAPAPVPRPECAVGCRQTGEAVTEGQWGETVWDTSAGIFLLPTSRPQLPTPLFADFFLSVMTSPVQTEGHC